MRTEQLAKCFVPLQKLRARLVPQIMFKPPPQSFITDRSKAVVLVRFSVACFGVRVSVTFHVMYVYIISVRFGLLSKELLTRLTISSLSIFTICNFSYFPFVVSAGIWF